MTGKMMKKAALPVAFMAFGTVRAAVPGAASTPSRERSVRSSGTRIRRPQGSLGYLYSLSGFLPVFNAGLSASVLQTWGDLLGGVEPGQTYAGIELTTAFSFPGLNAGVFRHVWGAMKGTAG